MTVLWFWGPALALSGVVVGLVVLGLVRGAKVRAAESGEKREVRVYADQLREIERDRQRGVVSAEEAERLRAETARRLLDADRKASAHLGESPRPMRALALSLTLAVPLAAIAVYWVEGARDYPDLPLAARHAEAEALRAARPSQTQMEALWQADPARLPPLPVDPEYLALVERLRSALQERPLDTAGFRLLAINEANLGNFADSATAWVRVIELQGEDAPVSDLVALAETMVQAAGGAVSPEAEIVLERVLRRDPRNGPARYYLGLALGQTGRPDLTFRLWRGLLEDSDPAAPWVPIIRAEIESLAQIAGVRYTLPPLEATGSRGPSAADIEAAAGMSEADRQAMIGGMVEGLAARLANQGGTPEDWARLIGALGVLGQTDRARAIWAEARLVFADRAEALAVIEAAARQQGFVE